MKVFLGIIVSVFINVAGFFGCFFMYNDDDKKKYAIGVAIGCAIQLTISFLVIGLMGETGVNIFQR